MYSRATWSKNVAIVDVENLAGVDAQTNVW